MELNDDGAGAGTVEELLGGAGGNPGSGGEAVAGAGGEGAGEGGASGGETGASDDFVAQFSAEVGEGETASLQDWVKSAGAKDVNQLAKMARDSVKALRDSGRIKVPSEGSTPEDVAAFHRAIGVPEDAKGYAVPEVKGADGNPIPLNMPFVERVMGSAHKHGVPKAAMDAVLADEAAAQAADHDAQLKALTTAANDHVKGWGADKEAKLAAVNAAAKEAGLTRADMEHMRAMPGGPGKMLDMMARFGASFSEDSLIRGDRKQFGVNAAEAQKDLDAMKANPDLARKAKVPGTPEHVRWQRNMEAVKRAAASNQTVDNELTA